MTAEDKHEVVQAAARVAYACHLLEENRMQLFESNKSLSRHRREDLELLDRALGSIYLPNYVGHLVEGTLKRWNQLSHRCPKELRDLPAVIHPLGRLEWS